MFPENLNSLGPYCSNIKLNQLLNHLILDDKHHISVDGLRQSMKLQESLFPVLSAEKYNEKYAKDTAEKTGNCSGDLLKETRKIE